MEQTTTLVDLMVDKWLDQQKEEALVAREKSLKFFIDFLTKQGITFSVSKDFTYYYAKHLGMYGYKFQDVACVSHHNSLQPSIILFCPYCGDHFLAGTTPEEFGEAAWEKKRHWCWRKFFRIKA